MTEREIKLQKIASFLDRHNLDGVMLWHRANFAWMTGGADNHINRASAIGAAGLIVTPGKIICITDTIESPRLLAEELVDIEMIAYPWHDEEKARLTLENTVGSKKIVTDFNPLGLDWPLLPTDFARVRWQLCAEEIERYRIGGKLASQAMESACRKIQPGMTEKQIAGILDAEVHARGGHPLATLIAADDRLVKFRHPIPTMKQFEKSVMLVLCSEFKGLVSNLTRTVHVGRIDEVTQARVRAVADMDAYMNLATRPGKSLGELFDELKRAYQRAGFTDEWKFHHQGGITGYMSREVLAKSNCHEIVQTRQAFAWNPSIPGCKSEDTVLIHGDGIEVLTSHSSSWPSVIGKSPGGGLVRADWLELM